MTYIQSHESIRHVYKRECKHKINFLWDSTRITTKGVRECYHQEYHMLVTSSHTL